MDRCINEATEGKPFFFIKIEYAGDGDLTALGRIIVGIGKRTCDEKLQSLRAAGGRVGDDTCVIKNVFVNGPVGVISLVNGELACHSDRLADVFLRRDHHVAYLREDHGAVHGRQVDVHVLRR